MKILRALSVALLAVVFLMATAEASARTRVTRKSQGLERSMTMRSVKAFSTVRMCWLIECMGSSGVCYAFGDVPSGNYFVETGKMNRYKVPCPNNQTPYSTHHTRIFAFDPDDPNFEAGYGCTNCDAWVNGANASVTEYDDSPSQTTFTEWKTAPDMK